MADFDRATGGIVHADAEYLRPRFSILRDDLRRWASIQVLGPQGHEREDREGACQHSHAPNFSARPAKLSMTFMISMPRRWPRLPFAQGRSP